MNFHLGSFVLGLFLMLIINLVLFAEWFDRVGCFK